jgi:hypothetical protein
MRSAVQLLAGVQRDAPQHLAPASVSSGGRGPCCLRSASLVRVARWFADAPVVLVAGLVMIRRLGGDPAEAMAAPISSRDMFWFRHVLGLRCEGTSVLQATGRRADGT